MLGTFLIEVNFSTYLIITNYIQIVQNNYLQTKIYIFQIHNYLIFN